MKPNNESKKLSPISRFIYLTIGIILGSALIIYGINYSGDVMFSVGGVNVGVWINAGIMVVLGVISGTFIKSGLLGKMRLD